MPNFNSGKSAYQAYSLGTSGQSVQSNGNFTKTGDAQSSQYILRNTTADATVTSLFVNGSSGKVALVPNSAVNFLVQVVARDAAGNAAFYALSGGIKQGANAAATAIVGTISQTVKAEDQAAWDATAIADTTLGALDIRVTGAAATNIKWVATVETVEVAY